RLQGDRDHALARLEGVRERLELRVEENDSLRSTLSAHRQASEAAAERSREVARQIAAAEGERAVAERRGGEALERGARLGERGVQLGTEIPILGEQTELGSGQGMSLRERLDAAADVADAAREEARVLRGREAPLRDTLRAAEDRVQRLASQ